ncbi:MAG TPA: tetratricopeptide repeat protein [Bryobacteraceae bacterium]|nr:tetratricopeptide repeat protein [Bryobacteraceae bacterium]
MSLCWLLLGVLSLAAVFWPTPRRRYCSELCSAHRAIAARAWDDFDRRVQRARKAALRMASGPMQEYALGDLDILEAQGAYFRGQLERAGGRLRFAVEHIERAGAPDRNIKISMARHFLGDVHLDGGDLEQAAEQYRAAVQTVAFTGEPEMAIFSLQRLSDVLIEKREMQEALEVVEQCVEYEQRILAKADAKSRPMISMIRPDLALASRDYATAERLFREKVDYWSRMENRSENIDLTRYQFHLAAAQQELGRYEAAEETLRQACELALRDYGPQHPRTARARRKLSQVSQLAEAAR